MIETTDLVMASIPSIPAVIPDLADRKISWLDAFEMNAARPEGTILPYRVDLGTIRYLFDGYRIDAVRSENETRVYFRMAHTNNEALARKYRPAIRMAA